MLKAPGARSRISSTVRMPAMPLPTTTSRGREASAFIVRPSNPRRTVQLGPCRAPAAADAGDAEERGNREQREDQEARAVAAGELLRGAERGGEIEPADAPGHADEPGHQPDLALETLRHELEHRTVPHAER